MRRRLIYILASVLTVPLLMHSAIAVDKNRASTYEERLLHLINHYRLINRLNPLSADETLYRLAIEHCKDMNDNNSLNHNAFDERFKQYKRMHCVENVGWNSPAPEDQFNGWKNSRGHNANLLDKRIKYAGIAKAGTYVTFFACE